LSERDETIEGLRRDLFSATANRGLVYTAILREMRKELGFTSMREHILYAANASVAASESWSWEPTTSSRSCCGVSEGMTTVA
jgi:hypothetical protein